MEEEKYFKRSWALLTRDKGWIKPILVMTAASLVPVVGFFGIQGYALEWARLTAWGVDSSPKQKNVDIGGCITSGARAFVVSLGLGLAVSMATGMITALFSLFPDVLGLMLGALASMAMSVVTLVAAMFILACQLRCAIYEQIGAGYRVDRVFEMVKRDTSGFARLVLLSFLCGLVVSAVVFVFVMIAVVTVIPVIMLAANSGSSSLAANAILSAIGPFIFVFALFVLLCDFLGNGILLIEVTATALWFRKFDVASWGKSEDPLPETGTNASWSPVAPAGPTERKPEVEPPALEAAHMEAKPKEEPATQEAEKAETVAPSTNVEPRVQDEGVVAEESGEDVSTEEQAPMPELSKETKDVDSLYADLYDVIQRDNHSDDE